MKKNYLKTNLISFIVGVVIFSCIGVYAVVNFPSNEVTYNNKESGLKSTNVKDAIDELYTECTKEPTAGEQIIDKEEIVTSGDGLYEDEYEDGRYLYRGKSPKNFIQFNNELWRIISVEADGTIKIRKYEYLQGISYDEYDKDRVTLDDAYYCSIAYSSGCNVWGSKTTMRDQEGNIVSQIIGNPFNTSKLYILPDAEADLNIYLNNEYYNQLSNEAKQQIVNHSFNVGMVAYSSGQQLETDIKQSKMYTWQGKVGLINVTEYVRAAAIDKNCASVYNYSTTSTKCYYIDNWMFDEVGSDYGLSNMTSYYYSGSDYNTYVWIIMNDYPNSSPRTGGHLFWPVVYLSSNIKITSGTGTSQDPYQISL